MEDVTDTVFRLLISRISNPQYLHLFMTEFISTDGMCHNKARDKVIHRLYICEEERKILKQKNIAIVAQIWGNNPDNYYKAVKNLTCEFDFDGVDINMGCPVTKVVKKGCCSALIENPTLAKELICAASEATHLPISVKTRIGYKTVATKRWANDLLSTQKLSALTFHGRTQKQMSEGLANWNQIAKAVKVRNSLGQKTLILGNGDIASLEDAHQKIELSKVDGVLVGRGIFQNPWLFNRPQPEINPEQRLKILWQHCQSFDEVWQGTKSFNILKRFFKIYISNFKHSSQLRQQLMQSKSFNDVKNILQKHIELD